jgi:hypothetical protein
MIWLAATTLALTLSIAIIDLAKGSKTRRLPIRSSSVVIYIAILFVGNTLAGLLAWPMAHSLLSASARLSEGDSKNGTTTPNKSSSSNGSNSSSSPSSKLATPDDPLQLPTESFIVIAAVLGVFGFHAIIKNVNISIYGKGFLTLDDWINKARDNAIAAVIEHATRKDLQYVKSVADELMKLDASLLNSIVLLELGPKQVAELEAIATSANANVAMIKAFAIARKDPTRASAHIPKNRR